MPGECILQEFQPTSEMQPVLGRARQLSSKSNSKQQERVKNINQNLC